MTDTMISQNTDISSWDTLYSNRIIYLYRNKYVSRDRAVGIATGHGLDGRGVGVWFPVGAQLFSSPRRPDQFWGPPSLLANGYRGKAAGA
jgi:hypothetical protein